MPRKPIEIDLAKVERFAAQGMTEAQIAAALGISQDTITRRKQNDADFADAIKRGQAKGIAVVTNKLMEQVQAGNITAMIFFLKCRADWKETQRLDHTSSDGSMSPKGKSLDDFYADVPTKPDA